MPKLNSFTKLFTLFIATAVIVSMWATPVNAQVQLTERSKLALDGIGSIRVGMTVDEASRAAGVRLVKINGGRLCSPFGLQEDPKGISFLVTKSRITAVQISNKNVTTIKGAKIGDTEEQIFSLYPGQIIVTKNPFGGSGNHLTFVPRDAADSNYRLIFRTLNRRVNYFKSGQLPEVEYAEGCL